jgi:hypothetical protein
MKVYELIAELSKMPAGADVEFATITTVDELKSCERVDETDDEVVYRLAGIIQDIEAIDDTLVAIYL